MTSAASGGLKLQCTAIAISSSLSHWTLLTRCATVEVVLINNNIVYRGYKLSSYIKVIASRSRSQEPKR